MSDKSTEDPLDRRLAALARRQHGVVSLRQLADLGLRRSAVAERARRGRLHRIHRGVYAVGHSGLTRNGRFMAAVLACGEGSALSHLSAAVLWGILEDRGQAIHVTAPGRRRVKGVVVHEGPLAGERVRRHGIVVTTPARTIVDLADVVKRRRTLERAIDEADYLRLDWTTAAPRHGRRGSGLLSSVLAVHEPGSTRTLAARSRLRSQSQEHPLEFGQAHGTRRAKERDPIRDADLQIAGWRVIRVTSMRLSRQPDALGDQLGRLLTPAPAALGALRRP
jgi:hypothetical protein